MVYRSTYVYPFLFYAFLLPKFPPDHRWNSYLRAIDNYVEKMVGLLCCTRKYLAPFDMYLYKCQELLMLYLDWSCSILIIQFCRFPNSLHGEGRLILQFAIFFTQAQRYKSIYISMANVQMI